MARFGSWDVDDLPEQLRIKEAIIDGISDILMFLDAATCEILEVNQAFINSYGLSREEVRGKKCYQVTHQLSTPCHQANLHCPCPLEESVATGAPAHAEHVHQDSEGNTHYFEITAYPVQDPSGQVSRIIHLSRDITRRKELELEVREREKLQGVLELAGATSHEINQPLTVILSGLEQLVKRLVPGDPEAELAHTILEHARRLAEISQRLAKITRYASKEYVAGSRIVDLEKASSEETE